MNSISNKEIFNFTEMAINVYMKENNVDRQTALKEINEALEKSVGSKIEKNRESINKGIVKELNKVLGDLNDARGCIFDDTTARTGINKAETRIETIISILEG